jgi:DNA-directed RNA polymerase specialized sigma24 family protein
MERLVEVFTEKAKSSKPMSDEDFARLSGAIYLDALELEPYIAACVLDELRKGRPDLFSGQVLAELLGGFSVAHISLWQNRRLAKAIDPRLQDGETRFEYLLKKAPWTALDAWEEEEEPPDLWSLRSKVARLLEKPEVPDIVGDFELQEAARQVLGELAEQAGLSKGERRVFELDMLTDYDTKAIARELDRSPTTVRGWRKRYRDKMGKASTS